MDLIFSLYTWWEGFEFSSLVTLLGFSCGFIPSLHVGRPLGIAPEAAWGTWVCTCDDQIWRWCSCLVQRSSGSTRYSGELVARAAGKYNALEGYGNQYWLIHSSILVWRTRLTEKPGRPQSTEPQSVGHDWSNPVHIDANFFLPVASLPPWELSVNVAWLLGLRGPWQCQVCRDTDCLCPRSYGLVSLFFEPLVAGDQKASLASLSP